MNKKIAIIAAVLAVLVAVYFALDKTQSKDTFPEPEYSVPAIPDLQKIEIVREEETLVFEKQGDDWRMLEPVEFDAAEAQIAEIAEIFEEAPVVDLSRSASESADSAGFAPVEGSGAVDEAPPSLRIKLYGAEGLAFDARVGRGVPSPNTGRVPTWIWPEGEDELYRIGADLRRPLELRVADYREKDIVNIEPPDVERVTLRYGGETVVLERATPEGSGAEATEEWVAVQPQGAVIDGELVDRAIRAVARMRATDFADEIGEEAAGLASPSHRLTLEAGDREITLALGGDVEGETGMRYVSREGANAIFEVREAAAEKIGSELGDFRPRDVLAVDEADVASVRLTNEAGQTMVLEASAEGDDEISWVVTAPRRVTEPVASVVGRVVRNAREVTASRFSGGISEADAGLDDPVRRVVLRLRDGSEHVLLLGAHAEQPANEGDEAARYAQLDGGDIFELSRYKVESLLKWVEDLEPRGDGG